MRRVALIGAGFIADAHLGGLATVKDAKVVAVVDPSLGRAEAMAGRLGAKAFSSVADLLAAEIADTAIVRHCWMQPRNPGRPFASTTILSTTPHFCA